VRLLERPGVRTVRLTARPGERNGRRGARFRPVPAFSCRPGSSRPVGPRC